MNRNAKRDLSAMKKISQYLQTISTVMLLILFNGDVNASLSVLTEGRPGSYVLEKVYESSKLKLHMAKVLFEGADLKRGEFKFKKNEKGIKSYTFSNSSLNSKTGLFVSSGTLLKEKSEKKHRVSLKFEPIKNGFIIEANDRDISFKITVLSK